jgi:formylglycine-generating enzyme required for sulfatase activity
MSRMQKIEQLSAPAEMLWIPGGAFHMGSANFYPEERPVREVGGCV